MRKVQFKKWIPAEYPKGSHSANCHQQEFARLSNTGCWEPGFSRDGTFHQWAPGYEEFESGPGNYTVALVEIADGTIEEVLPTHIKFINDYCRCEMPAKEKGRNRCFKCKKPFKPITE